MVIPSFVKNTFDGEGELMRHVTCKMFLGRCCCFWFVFQTAQRDSPEPLPMKGWEKSTDPSPTDLLMFGSGARVLHF